MFTAVGSVRDTLASVVDCARLVLYFDLVHIDIEVARSPITALSQNTRVLSTLNEGPWSISRRLRASRSSTDALGIRDPLAQPVSCPPHVDSSPLARAVTLPTVVGVALTQVTRRVCPEYSVCVCFICGFV